MKKKKAKVLMVLNITHDVKSLVLEKPKNYKFKPGQATDVSINRPKWKDEERPFTFTSLEEDLALQFTIKGYPLKKYPKHSGATEKIHALKPGDELLIADPWGTIQYKGKGVFIAGGAGVTPFIAILRMLNKKGKIKGHKLIFSNKTKKDIILEQEFRAMFEDNPDDLVLTLSRERVSGYEYGRIDKNFLKRHIKDFKQNFYICGPKPFVEDMKKILSELGAKTNSLVFEE